MNPPAGSGPSGGVNGGRFDRLLIRQPEEIAEEIVRADVRHMLENEGVWIGGDSNHPKATVPLASMGGKVYAMKRDQELDPARFLSTLTLAGPFTSERPDPEAWRSAVDDLPPPLTLVLVWFPTNEVRVGQYHATSRKWGPPRLDRLLKIQPTHWRPLPLGPGGAEPVTKPTLPSSPATVGGE